MILKERFVYFAGAKVNGLCVVYVRGSNILLTKLMKIFILDTI